MMNNLDFIKAGFDKELADMVENNLGVLYFERGGELIYILFFA